MITGSAYLERGEPVVVEAAWNGAVKDLPDLARLLPHVCTRRSGPRNVLIRRADGTSDVRPFRGLRKPAAQGGEPR